MTHYTPADLDYLSYPRNSTAWGIAGPDTFRLASKQLWGKRSIYCCGSNLQNVDHDLLKIYTPDKGRVLIQPDQSGAEALVVAHECEPGNLLEMFKAGIKPHVYLGLLFPSTWEKKHPAVREIGSLKISEVPSHPNWKALSDDIKASDHLDAANRHYYLYKKTCHSGNYEVEERTLQQAILVDSNGAVSLTTKQSAALINAYRDMCPEIVDWRRKLDRMVKSQTLTLHNLFGFPRTFHYLTERNKKQIYAFIPQSTVGTITNIAFTKLQHFIEDNKLAWDLLNNKHDSFLIQCPVPDLDECIKISRGFIEQELVSSRGVTYRMRSGVSVGYSWGELEEMKS